MPMARALHEHLGIPAEVLLQTLGVSRADPLASIEWNRFPLKAMANARLDPERSRTSSCVQQELIGDLIRRAGGPAVAAGSRSPARTTTRAPMPRWIHTRSRRGAGKCLPTPARPAPRFRTRRGIHHTGLPRPARAPELVQRGPTARQRIPRQARHLPRRRSPLAKTYLDGAALKLADGTPVVGLTLRYDRIDSFWFCLLHELAPSRSPHGHVTPIVAFVDDLTLREIEGSRRDPKEARGGSMG